MRKIPWISQLLVAIQGLGMIFSLNPFPLNPHGWTVFLAVSAAGAGVGLWTVLHNRPGNFSIFPDPLPQGSLITSGPYRFIRHPMYASLILITGGAAFYQHYLSSILGFCFVLIAVYGKIEREEKMLQQRFPQYHAYAQQTSRLLPGVY